jgi:glycosyltransferase involved in cell wall biosynthesis
LCAQADLVVFPAEHTRRKVQARMPGIKAVVVPSGVSIDKVGSVSGRRKSPAAQRTLLHVGRLVVEKDIAMLIRALALLPREYTLVLVGDGPERGRLERQVRSLDLSRRVKFVGKVPHARVAQYYRGAGMLVVASETETQGLVFLEAMAQGLPIVAAESLAAREWVGPNHGLIVKRNAEAVARGVIKLATADLTRMATAQKRTARQYTTTMMIKRIEKAYKETIAARAAR